MQKVEYVVDMLCIIVSLSVTSTFPFRPKLLVLTRYLPARAGGYYEALQSGLGFMELISDKGKIPPRLVGPRRGRSGRVWKISFPPEFDPRTVANSYTNYTIPVHGVNELGCLISAVLDKHSQSVKPAKLVFQVRQHKVS